MRWRCFLRESLVFSTPAHSLWGQTHFSGASHSPFFLGLFLANSTSRVGSTRPSVGCSPGGSFLPVMCSECSTSDFSPTFCWGSSCFAPPFHVLQGTFRKGVCIIKNLLRKLLLWPTSQAVEGLKKYVLFQDGFGKHLVWCTLCNREGILFTNLIANLLVPIFIPQGPHHHEGLLLGWLWCGWIWLIPTEGPSAQAFPSTCLCPCVQLLLHAVLWFLLRGLHQDLSTTSR